jgi:hypothetical protein
MKSSVGSAIFPSSSGLDDRSGSVSAAIRRINAGGGAAMLDAIAESRSIGSDRTNGARSC